MSNTKPLNVIARKLGAGSNFTGSSNVEALNAIAHQIGASEDFIGKSETQILNAIGELEFGGRDLKEIDLFECLTTGVYPEGLKTVIESEFPDELIRYGFYKLKDTINVKVRNNSYMTFAHDAPEYYGNNTVYFSVWDYMEDGEITTEISIRYNGETAVFCKFPCETETQDDGTVVVVPTYVTNMISVGR